MIRINFKTGRYITLVCSLIFGCLFTSNAQILQPTYSTTVDVNSVVSYTSAAPIADMPTLLSRSLQDVKQAIQYVDGLGRPVQTVVKQGSLNSNTGASTDLVNTILYDGFGREQYKYLPFAANGNNTNDGTFKLNAFKQQADFSAAQYPGETFFYSKTNFDGSPLNRVTATYAPGNSWAGSEGNIPALQRSVQVKYAFNTVTDDVKLWTVNNNNTAGEFGSYQLPATGDNFYAAGELYKTITTDEHKHQVIEFKDKEGKVILKKMQLTAAADDGTGSGYAGWLCTYYIYDVLGNLRCVIQPEGVKAILTGWSLTTVLLNEQCFRYEYDQRNRMIKKQVPGAAPVSMVYDVRDRLVLTQDGNLAAAGKWLYTQYDVLNRPVATGLWPSSLTRAQHATAAAAGSTYPALNGAEEELTRTFYDEYDSWLSANGSPFSSARSTADDDYLNAATSAYPYTQEVTQSNAVKGMVTGSKVKVLGTSNTYLYSIIYYDYKGRAIQTQSQNISGGTDVNTTQYNWAGQPLLSVMRQEKSGSNPQTTIVVSNITYDVLGRPIKTEKKLSNTLVNRGAMSDYKTIAQMEYDALGQVKKKKLGTKPESTAELENLTYDYNIRGWLLGANREYAKDANSANYFGFDLGYDKANNNIIGNQAYATPQYNGNIEGMVWKTKGDGEKRKYDFTYDGVNRLLAADFNQYTGTSFDKSAGIDFTVKMGDGITAASAYDANGNIMGMTQYGLKINTSVPIDQLQYTYTANTNKLAQVTDAANDNSSVLGDFKYDPATKTGTDYSYDVNGNMTADNNKHITAIIYNHLNLPQDIEMAPTAAITSGSIHYVYDAAGNKLQKIVTEMSPLNNITTHTTTYINGIVYERIDQPGNGQVGSTPGRLQTQEEVKKAQQGQQTGINAPSVKGIDELQFIPHEEGRIRFKPAVTDERNEEIVPAAFAFDYFLKDHLGNVRVVLTDEIKQDKYPVASLEDGKVRTEMQYYAIDQDKRVDKSAARGMPDYINDNGIGNNPGDPNFETTNSQYVYKMNGGDRDMTGLGITLKVMAGDKIDVLGKSYYFENSSVPNTNNTLSVTDMLSGFLGGATGGAATTVHGPVTAAQITPATGIGSIYSMFTEQDNQSNASPARPRAFINVIFFDEQFKAVKYQVSMVGDNSELKDHYSELQNIEAPKNGFVYIYCSNETPVDVFFDNLQVVHTRGAILEENSYYPFGLVMNGISSKAAGSLENKRKFNSGSELQSKEFSDGSGLELYATNFRSLDPQLGRWWQIDPKPTNSESLYCSMGNNPVLNNDPLGDVIEGVNKISAKRELKIIKENFRGKEAKELRNLFKIGKDGMTFDKIDQKSFDDAVSKLKSTDAQALARGYVKTINAEKSVFVNVLKSDNEVAKIENPRVGTQFKGTDGAPSLILSLTGRQYEGFGGGVTSPVSSQGNYLVGIRMGTSAATEYVNATNGETVSQPATAGEISAHEILGHVLAAMCGYSNNGQQSIRASNIYLRNENTNLYRNGGGSHGKVMSEEEATAIPGYLGPLGK